MLWTSVKNKMFKNYSKAPIKEAILDVHIKEIDGIDLIKIKESLSGKLPKGFKIESNIVNFGGKIKIDKGKSEFISSEEILKGFIISKDNFKIQFRKDGFTVNFLSPYTRWEEFFKLALEFWRIYQENFTDIYCEKIGLRYINEIKIPLPLGNFKDYIVNMPPIPKCLPQNYSHFFMQIEVPCENDFIAQITETIIESQEKYILPFVLDINIQKRVNGKIKEKDFEDEFNYMRRLKNLIFEDFITDNTRKLINCNENRN